MIQIVGVVGVFGIIEPMVRLHFSTEVHGAENQHFNGIAATSGTFLPKDYGARAIEPNGQGCKQKYGRN